MSVDANVIDHYGGNALLGSIEAGLKSLGLSREAATVDVLGTTDEFHVGGRPATIDLCTKLGVESEMTLLDVGCGIGGTARLLASTFGCSVTGIDLSPNYVATARELSEWTGMSDRVRFEVGNAVDMPLDSGSFDGAVQLHVGMNIEDKQSLFAEVLRVLRPGGRFGVYDIVRTSPAPLTFPVPWATNESMSFVDDLATYRTALATAGFEIEHIHDRIEFAREFFAQARRNASSHSEPPPLGLHVILGRDAPSKIANMVSAINKGAIAPVQIVCRAPARTRSG